MEQTNTQPTGGLTNDPFHALGTADAYDEHHLDGLPIDVLCRRVSELLDAPGPRSAVADLYITGYATAVIGLLDSHIATVNAQAELAHSDHRKAHR